MQVCKLQLNKCELKLMSVTGCEEDERIRVTV